MSSIITIPVRILCITQSTRSTIEIANGTILNRRANSNTFPYTSFILSNHGCFTSFVFLRSTEPIVGTTVSATNKEAINA